MLPHEVDAVCWPLFDAYELNGRIPLNRIIKESGCNRNQVEYSRAKWGRRDKNQKPHERKPLRDFFNETPGMPIVETVPALESAMPEPIPEIIQDEIKPVSADGIYSVVVLPCCHVPWVRQIMHPALESVIKYISANRPDEIILCGDFGNFDSINYFDRNRPLKREGKRLSHDYNAINYSLDILQTLTSKVTYLFGNHEVRVERYIEANPEQQGIMEIQYQCQLERRGIEWYEENIVYQVGKASFLHGHKYNMYHPKAMALMYGSSIYYAHTHDSMSFVLSNHAVGTVEGYSLGCLTDLQPAYVRNIPRRHDNAFGIFHFTEDGYFTRYIPKIMNGKFVGPDRKLYTG